MFFQKMRQRTKFIIIVVVAAMAGGLLWAGGAQLFGGRGKQQLPVEAVVAVVNGQGISYYDLHQTFIQRLQQIESQQGQVPGSAYQSVKYQALESLVGSVLLSQEISGRKITASQEEIERELRVIVEQFPSIEEYKVQLEAAGLSEEYLKATLAEDIKFGKLKNEILADIPVSEEEIESAYEQVRASHILVIPEDRTDEGWAAAKEKALQILDEITVANFAELAESYSEDGSKSQGGDLGFLSRGRTVPEFEAAVFNLEIDEISEPIRSEYGYHIITVTDRKEAQGEEFERVRDGLAQMIREEKGREDLAAWYEQLRDGAEVIFTDHEMNAFEQVTLGNFEDAAHYYRLAIEEQPEDGYLYASLGDLFKQQGEYEEAISQYQLAVEKYNNDYELYIALGNLYQEVERVDEAVDSYLIASELASNDIFTQLALYQVLNDLERDEDLKLVEERIKDFQELQKELWGSEEIAEEIPDSGAEPPEVEAALED